MRTPGVLKAIGAAGVMVWAAQALGQAVPVRVKLLTTPEELRQATSRPSEFTMVGATTYFVAEDRVNGRELWKTDGTPEGTVLVRDIWPGNSTLTGPRNLYNFNGVLLFTASDGEHGLELWRSDGTPTGTVMVKDIRPGSLSSEPTEFIDGGSQIFFNAVVTQWSPGFWRTDGTAEGTYRVTVAGACCLGDGSCRVLVPPECELLHGWTQPPLSTCEATACRQPVPFVCCLPDGRCLFLYANLCAQQNGTLLPAGSTCLPRMCAPLPPAACCLSDQQCVLLTEADCLAAGGAARGAHAACEPANLCICTPEPCVPAFVRCCFPDGSCRSAQTSASCSAAGGVGSGANVSCNVTSNQCVERLVGCCYNDGDCRVATLSECQTSGGLPIAHGSGVCSTASCPTPSPGAGAVGQPVLKVGDRVFIYNGDDSGGRTGLWVWDGTPMGFTYLKAFPPFNSNYEQVPRYFLEFNGKLLFTMSDGVSGNEWWSSDGTAAGTALLADINPGAAHSSPAVHVKAGAYLYFFASDAAHGRQLWRTDGSASGTQRLTLLPNLQSSYTGPIVPLGDSVVFFARVGASQSLLFALDSATPEGCVALSSRNVSTAAEAVTTGSRVFFTHSSLQGLWTTDGTPMGTHEVVSTEFTDDWNPSSLRWIPGLNRLLFGAGELWMSDGTAAGTRVLKDIAAGVSVRTVRPVGGSELVFSATEPGLGQEMFISDGTAVGTRLLKDINPGAGNSLPQNLTRVGEQVFFTADSPGRTQSLWVSDLTAAGTHIVGDTVNAPYFRAVGPGVVAGERIFFAGSYSDGSQRLWCRENGRFTELPPITGSLPSFGHPFAAQLYAVHGGVLYLINTSGLWRSDGTPAGTFRLKASTEGGSMYAVFTFGAEVAFVFQGELWRTDGTVGGTLRADPLFNPNVGGAVYAPGATGVYFAAGGTQNYSRLYKSELAPGTTRLVKDLSAAQGSAFLSSFLEYNGLMYFSRSAGSVELYRTDGTLDGTVPAFPTQASTIRSALDTVNGRLLVHSYNPSSQCWTLVSTTGTMTSNEPLTACIGNQSPLFIMKIGTVAYYTSHPGLWRTDGTAAGTYVVPGAADMSFSNLASGKFAAFQGQLYLTASRADVGTELFRLDPATDAIALVADLNPGPSSSSPSGLAATSTELVFSASAGASDRLWLLTDTTTPPSVVLGPAPSPTSAFQASSLTASGNYVYCVTPGDSVVRSDGTTPGTIVLGNYASSTSGVDPHDLLDFDGKLMFVASVPSAGEEIFVADPAVQDAPRRIVIAEDHPQSLAKIGNRVFFLTRPSSGGERINVTDGSQEGTGGVNVNGWFDVLGSSITDLNGLALFSAEDNAHGYELWRSDGTSAGTYVVKDLKPGPVPGGPTGLTAFNGFVYFTADDGIHGRELWRSDGTEAGTSLVRDIWIGEGGAGPTWLTRTGNRLHFVAYTPETGPELWITDGTPGGTFMLFQLADGPGGANIDQLTVSGDRLYFLATTLPDGTALWTYEWPGALLAFCPSDYTRSGGVGVGDIFAFLADWFGGASRADFNGSGTLTVQDIFDFLTAYFSGCQ